LAYVSARIQFYTPLRTAHRSNPLNVCFGESALTRAHLRAYSAELMPVKRDLSRRVAVAITGTSTLLGDSLRFSL
jgi:hypothetical protein